MRGLTEQLARLRAEQPGWAALGYAARRERLCAWAAGWAAAPSPAGVAALATEAGLSPEAVAWGVRTTLEVVTPGALDRLVGGLPEGVPVVGHVWASTLPTSGWLPVVACLALGSAVAIKAPAGAKEAAEALAGALARELGAPVVSASWARGAEEDEALAWGCDGLVVSGGAEAVARFGVLAAQHPGGPIPALPFGPGLSLAVVPAEALEGALEGLADALALDVAAYDQRGCLSPQQLWVEEHPRAEELAAAVAAALTRVARWMPRGVVDAGAGAAILQRRGTAAFQGAVYGAEGAVVLWEPTPYRGDNPRCRTLPVHVFEGGVEGLEAALRAYPSPIQRVHGLAVAGERARWAPLARRLRASRLCAPGTLQTPPLGWHHDGMAWVEQLVRYLDVE